MFDDLIVGIDLGTTNTVVTWFNHNNGKYEILPFGDSMEDYLPSVVYVENDDETLLTGKVALNKGRADPSRMIRSSKRNMGISTYMYPDPEHSFRKTLRPVDVATCILKDVHQTLIKRGLCNEDTPIHAVITVPNGCYGPAKEDTITAGREAGLDVMTTLSEPVAAAIHYIKSHLSTDDRILVCDFGGGTLDLTYLKPKEDSDAGYISYGHGDNSYLGGDNIDEALFKEFKKRILSDVGIDLNNLESSGLSPKDYGKAVGRLREAAEIAKIDLSRFTMPNAEKNPASRTRVYLENLLPVNGLGWTFDYELTLKKFNELCADVYKSFVATFESMFKESSLTVSEVTKVLFVGGSCNIPRIRELVREMFPQAELRVGDLSKAVSYGACMKALKIDPVDQTCVHDLGVALTLPDGKRIFEPLIEAKTPLPHESTRTFRPFRDYATTIPVMVYERPTETTSTDLDKCKYWGAIILRDFLPGPRKDTTVDVTFSLSANNNLTVTATRKTVSGETGTVSEVIIQGVTPEPPVTKKAVPMDIYLLLDKSFSMTHQDTPTQERRIKVVQDAIQEMVQNMIDPQTQRLGVITFADQDKEELLQELTTDKNELLKKVYEVMPDGDATYVSSAVKRAIDELETSARPECTKAIIVLTDGEFHDREERLIEQRELATIRDVKIATIGIDPNGAIRDRRKLQNLATKKPSDEPMSYYTTNIDELQELFGDILDGLSDF